MQLQRWPSTISQNSLGASVDDVIALITKTYGLVGLLILAPIFACYLLWRQNQTLHDEAKKDADNTAKAIAEASNRVVATTEQRVKDTKELADKLIAMSSEHAALVRENNLALDEVSKLLRDLSTRLQIRR